VVTVNHDHDADNTGRKAPRVLPYVDVLALGVGVLDLDVEHLAKVLAEAVGRRALNASPVGGDVALDRGGVKAASELLILSLSAPDDGNREKLLVNAGVELEDLDD